MVFGGHLVKRILMCAALFGAAPGLMQASGVIAVSCGGTSALTSSTVCSNNATYGNILETFGNDYLQWNGANDIASPTLTATNPSDPALANGVMYDTTWDAVGLPFTVTGSELDLADNYIEILKGTKYVPPVGSHPQIYEGTFNSQPGVSAGTPGDYLLGSGGTTGGTTNGGLPADAITIASTGNALSSFGFRISSSEYTSFDAVIQLYDQNGDAIGTPLTYSNLGGGGLCPTLAVTPGQPTPVACNTAPFIQVTTGAGVYSFSVYTTQTNGQADNGGFFLDTFYYAFQTSGVPEPGSLLLAGAGLVSMVALGRRRNGRQALGHVGAETIDKA